MPALADITPVILTYNEAANIGRCLEHLSWAKRIIVLDSGSEDDTLTVARTFANVEIHTRPFDSHAHQWRHAVENTGISTDWVLALDADYIVPEDTRAWIAALDGHAAAGVSFPFRYAVRGRVLRSGIYPPVTALYRRAGASYVQDGHTQRVVVDGPVVRSPRWLVHDDRKPLEQWFRTQAQYARLEAEKLRMNGAGFKTWLRTRTPASPLLVGLHCLLVRGGLFEGPPGWLYALQRTVAEGMIAVAYHDAELENRKTHADPRS